jgi:C1A family cysteine protease
MNRVLKHNPRKHDPRDHTFSIERDPSKNVETFITIKKNNTLQGTKPASASSFTVSPLPSIIDQGNLGSCTANAFYYTTMQQTKNMLPLSRLYLYANCRCIDDMPLDQDVGTTVATVCKAVSNYGLCNETIYPYIIKNYVDLPPLNAYQGAKKLKIFNYTYIKQDLNSLKGALTLYNVPIIFGIFVYDSFLTSAVASNGMVPMPNTNKETLKGGHCVTLVGYNDANQTFMCANSWGTLWGNKGYFYLPYAYVTNPNLAFDFCVTSISM